MTKNNKLRKKYLIFHNGEERFNIVEDIINLKDNLAEVLSWIKNEYEDKEEWEDNPNRISIYELEEAEFTWENISSPKNEFLLVNESTYKYNNWQDRKDIGFAIDDFDAEELFDKKEKFECNYSFYIAKEIFYAYFNDSDIRTSGMSDNMRDYGKDFLIQFFDKWKNAIRESLSELVKRIETGGEINRITQTIPFNVSETKAMHSKEDIVGITITDEGEIKFTSMSMQDCKKYIWKHYPKTRRRYHNQKFISAFTIVEKLENNLTN